MKPLVVESTTLITIAYDPDCQSLQLEFRDGAIYHYFDVPAHVYQAWSPLHPRAATSIERSEAGSYMPASKPRLPYLSAYGGPPHLRMDNASGPQPQFTPVFFERHTH